MSTWLDIQAGYVKVSFKFAADADLPERDSFRAGNFIEWLRVITLSAALVTSLRSMSTGEAEDYIYGSMRVFRTLTVVKRWITSIGRAGGARVLTRRRGAVVPTSINSFGSTCFSARPAKIYVKFSKTRSGPCLVLKTAMRGPGAAFGGPNEPLARAMSSRHPSRLCYVIYHFLRLA